MSDYPEVRLRNRLQQGVGIAFQKMVLRKRVPPGSIVRVLEPGGRVVGHAYYVPDAPIALRFLTFGAQDEPTDDWFRDRLAAAVRLRHEVLRLPERTNAYRLVHGEGDGLPGMVADRLGNVVVFEVRTRGVFKRLGFWIAMLKDIMAPWGVERVRVIGEKRAQEIEGFTVVDTVEASGTDVSGEVTVYEDTKASVSAEADGKRVSYRVDLRGGHKTGFFCDQRETRALITSLATGMRIYDGCCYTGGFALSALAGGASQVRAVDLDEESLAVARQNAALNGRTDAIEFVHADVFNDLRSQEQAGETYDLVVLDPAKMAAHRQQIPKALHAYTDMNRLGIGRVRPGGLLLTCSCTGLVTQQEFQVCVQRAAEQAGRRLQVLELRGPSADHPWDLITGEGRYLKGILAQVW